MQVSELQGAPDGRRDGFRDEREDAREALVASGARRAVRDGARVRLDDGGLQHVVRVDLLGAQRLGAPVPG